MRALRHNRVADVNWPAPGSSTAHPLNVSYRVSKIADLISGRWLDLGCADGGYTAELLRRGATEVVGVDFDEVRIANAIAKNLPGCSFQVAASEELPFPDAYFDGVFMNEVFEHVHDERRTLMEVARIVRADGTLVLISPNRWFPFEGHGMRLSHMELGFPVPLVPWLPQFAVSQWMTARNYWPYQLVRYVESSGFGLERLKFVWPVMERYRYLPSSVLGAYQAHIELFDRLPVLRRFGVSTLIVGRRHQ